MTFSKIWGMSFFKGSCVLERDGAAGWSWCCRMELVLLERVGAAGEGWGMLLNEAVTVCSQYFCKQ